LGQLRSLQSLAVGELLANIRLEVPYQENATRMADVSAVD
jgi:hypothetical protein